MDRAITTTDRTTLRVDGHATVTAEPDQAIVHFQVEGRSKRPGADAVVAVERCEQLAEAVRAVPNGRVEMPSVTSHQEGWWDGDRHRDDGDWVAWRRGTVTVDVDHAAPVIAHLVASSVDVSGIRWEVSDRTALNERARIEAVAVAHRSALDHAAAIGAELGDLVALDAGASRHGFDPGGYEMVAHAMADGGPRVELDPTDVEGSASVTTMWTLR